MRVGGKVVKAPPSLAPEPEKPAGAGVAEPTADERRNGWTRETLAQYLQDRADQRQSYEAKLSDRKIREARSQDTVRFDPHRW